MKLLAKSFLILLLLERALGFLSDAEWRLLLGILKNTYVRRVIFAPETISPENGSLVKKLSAEKVSSVLVRRDKLRKYLRNPDFSFSPWTAVVLKEDDLKSACYLKDSSIIPSFLWLLFDSSNGTLKEDLAGLYIPLNAVLLLIEEFDPDHYVLNEYYQIKKSTRGVFQTCAEWRNGEMKLAKTEWYLEKSDFLGHELNTVKYNEDLYLTPKEKINEAIWKELSFLLNFTINQKLIGYSPKNGSVELVKEEDEALLDTAIYIGNTQKFRYLLGPTSQSSVYMHVRAEGEYKGLKRFMMPFSKYTWWCIGVWICCCASFSCLIEYLSRKFRCSDKPSEESYLMAFISLDGLCNQCGAEISGNLASRFMLLLIKFSSCVIFYSYGATLISYLLLYIPQLPFVDLRGFVEDGTYKIIGERNSDVDAFFNVSAVPLERLVYANFLVDATKWERLDKEVDRMCAGEKLVLVAYDNDVDKYRPCHIVKIEKPLKVVANGFKIRHQSPYRGVLHVKLLLLRSTGVLKKLNSQIAGRSIKRDHSKSEYKVRIEKISSAFFLLLGGYLFSIVILIIETVVKRFTSSRYKNQYLE